MERAKVERILVVLLFVMVLVVFSFAERDSRKLDKLYSNAATAIKQQYLAKHGQTTSTTDY